MQNCPVSCPKVPKSFCLFFPKISTDHPPTNIHGVGTKSTDPPGQSITYGKSMSQSITHAKSVSQSITHAKSVSQSITHAKSVTHSITHAKSVTHSITHATVNILAKVAYLCHGKEIRPRLIFCHVFHGTRLAECFAVGSIINNWLVFQRTDKIS